MCSVSVPSGDKNTYIHTNKPKTGGWSRLGARRPLDDCLTTPARHTRGRVVALLWVATWGCGRAAMDRARGLGFHLVKRAGLLESPVFEHGGRLGQLCGRCAVATLGLFLRLLSLVFYSSSTCPLVISHNYPVSSITSERIAGPTTGMRISDIPNTCDRGRTARSLYRVVMTGRV